MSSSGRCLVLQSDGEHKGQDGWTANAFLRECHALRHAFEAHGVATDLWGPRHAGFPRDNAPDYASYDLILCAENYGLDWLPDLTKVRGPLKLQWIVDLHFQGPRPYGPVTRGCDVVLHATRALIDSYRREHPRQRHLWFPNAVDDRYFDAAKVRRERVSDLIFVASDLPDRRAFVDEMKRRAGLVCVFATGADMIERVAGAKIHFNRNVRGDVNYRTFETIGLGTCLLTDADDALAELGFVDGENCLTYRSADEAVAKAARALGDGSWARIGAAGYALSRRHTYVERVRALLDVLAVA